jgi:hypothetical protein
MHDAPLPTPTPYIVVNVPAPVVNVTPVVSVPPTVVNVPDSPSPIEPVTFFVGVTTIILAQGIVQLYAVPRGERTKRADDRWEKNLHELIDLLGEMSNGSRDVRSAGFSLLYLVQHKEDIEPQRYQSEWAVRKERVSVAEDAWSAQCDRARWLGEQVIARAPNRLRDFHARSLAREVYDMRVTGVAYLAEEPEDATKWLEKWDENWARERDARDKLLKQAKQLARDRAEGASPGGKAFGWLGTKWASNKVKRKWRQRAKRKAQEQLDKESAKTPQPVP